MVPRVLLRLPPPAVLLLVSAWFAGRLPSPAAADEFQLANGGVLSGRLVNADETPRTTFVVALASGGTVTLERNQVREVLRRTADDLEYDRLRHAEPDTVAGHGTLAQWCSEHKLVDRRNRHLKRIIELDPNHREARAGLGYNRINGRWVTTDEHQTALGKVMHKGQYRYPQEIEILENRERADKARQHWYGQLKRWRDQLSSDKSAGAVAGITGITDPAAVTALQEYLTDEKNEDVRKLYVQALARIGTGDALVLLVDRSLNDPSDEVRLTCLDVLDDTPRYSLISLYIQALRSADNNVVNRSASALSRFKDPRSLLPLIEGLVTQHKLKVTTGSSSPGGISAGNSSMGSGLSMGQSTKIITQKANNEAVLETLVVMTGQNFRYDVAAWKQWYAGRKKNQLLDIRRN